MTFKPENPTMEINNTTGNANYVSTLLEDAGNCRKNLNQELSLHLLGDTCSSEQQKLRHVLDWAHRFLSSGSEVYHELCRADSLILDNEKKETEKGLPTCEDPSAVKYHCQVSCAVGTHDVLEGGSAVKMEQPSNFKNSEQNNFLCRFKSPLQEDLHTPHAFTQGRDETIWTESQEIENMKNMKLQQTTNKPTPSLEYRRTGRQYVCNQRYQTNMSDSSADEAFASDAATCLVKESTSCFGSVIGKKSTSACGAAAPLKSFLQSRDSTDIIHKGMAKVEPEKRVTRLEKSDGNVHKEHYPSSVFMVLVNHNMSMIEPEEIPRQTANPSFSHLLKTSPNLTVYEQYQLLVDQLYHFRQGQHIKQGCSLESSAKVKKTTKEKAASVEASAPPTSCFGLNTTNRELSKQLNKARSRMVTAAETTEKWCLGAISKNQGRTSSSASSRPQSAAKNMERLRSKKHTLEDRVKNTSPHRDTHSSLQSTETHTCHHDDTRPTSSASGANVYGAVTNLDCPAGVPVCNGWMYLPDEVWLSILSLLPPRDLCRVVQVCRRLHTLATDHSLWKHLRVENSTLTEQWLLSVGKLRPHSLSLYSCSGLSVTSFGLEMFFTLCGNSLKEVKVTSCTGPGLHGDQMLSLIGRLCNHMTSVDVSWSGATDTGVKALSDGSTGSKLKSVVFNGCHVTDDPLKRLVMRHKESLCRLEVFGCQFLTPSCLQTIFQVCPGLKQLNIGQVPKVNAHSLIMMASQLKCLISLNLTALQAVTDATVDMLLQNCVKLQSLVLSSCPGVTDLTLYNISKYTPCIRSLDISGCKAVTDVGVQSLSLGCRQLQQLDLSSTSTGNRGITLLANYCSGHFRTVKLSFCHITSESILKLCKHCKRLEVLHLYGCANVPTETEIREVNAVVQVFQS